MQAKAFGGFDRVKSPQFRYITHFQLQLCNFLQLNSIPIDKKDKKKELTNRYPTDFHGFLSSIFTYILFEALRKIRKIVHSSRTKILQNNAFYSHSIYYIRERKIQGKQIVKDYVCKIDTAVDNLPLRHRHSDHGRGHVGYIEYHQRIHHASLIRS